MNARSLFLFVVALGIATTPLKAENREGAFTLSPFAGAQGFPFSGEGHYDFDFDWGVRGGYNFTDNIRLELVFGENRTVHDPGDWPCTMYQYGFDVLYAFMPDQPLVPFVSAGFGAFDVKFHQKGGPSSDETNAYFNYGVGMEYALTRWLSLRTEFHHAIMLKNGDSSLQGTIGFTIYFGGR